MEERTSTSLAALALTLAGLAWVLPVLFLGLVAATLGLAIFLSLFVMLASALCVLFSTGFAIAALRQRGPARGLAIAALVVNLCFAGGAAWLFIGPPATLAPTEVRPMK